MSEYPSDEQLETIKAWDVLKTGIKPLVEYVRELWKYGDDYTYLRKGKDKLFKKPCMKFELHTFGWSGNEQIVYALEQNFMFWCNSWNQTNRGGHYRFEIRMDLWEKK